jgi:predicted RNA-binding protein (virulence factor B family)
MLKLGQINSLKAVRQTDNGFYLSDDELAEVLLPNKYVANELETGNIIDVFLYKDSEDMLVATTLTPKVMLHEYAVLQAKAVGTFGAFFDWGLEKDLLVPYRQQAKRITEGENYVVYLYLDEASQRLAGRTKLNGTFTKIPADLKIGDQVSLLPYTETELGINVIVNNAYQGILFRNEIFETVEIAKAITGYVKKIRNDNKIDISLHRLGYKAIDVHVQKLLNILEANGGQLGLNDKSTPQDIVNQLGMSKKMFKKSVGALYKTKQIVLTETGIELTKNSP